MALSPDQQHDVADSISRDKDNLFSLADKIIAAAPLRQWGVWIADACSAYFLAHFLREAYILSDAMPENAPSIVHIANSRPARNDPYHRQVVIERLTQSDLAIAGKNVLILSDYTKDRHALSTLTAASRRAGALAVDAAVLNLDTPGGSSFPTDMPDAIYAGTPRNYEPELLYGILKDAVGQESIPGCAEPRDTPDADLELRAYVHASFSDLAHAYTAQRR